MEKETYKVGDRILVKDLFSCYYECDILAIKKDWLGIKYFCEWRVDMYGKSGLEYSFDKMGYKRPWKIEYKVK